MSVNDFFMLMILFLEIGLLIFGIVLFFKTIETENIGIEDKKGFENMHKLEIEISDRVARELYIFCQEQKNDIVSFSETCGDFETLTNLEEDFKTYDTIESKLEEL